MSAALEIPVRLAAALAPPERRGLARDGVRMLVTDRNTRMHTHAHFYRLHEFLQPGDLLVVNDTQTMPAALEATRNDGSLLNLHVSTMIGGGLWHAEPRGPAQLGERVTLRDGAEATLLAPLDPAHQRLWYTAFSLPLPMSEYLMRFGEPIRYGYVTQRFPLSDYQTIFARTAGSSEMPSAARPFTPRTLAALRKRDVEIATITLHCGVSSFEAPERPGIERFAVSPQTAWAVNAARSDGRRVIATGTTVVRALESAISGDCVIAASGWTDRVVDPDHPPRAVDALLTGFHDASSTHQWMLNAFADSALLGDAYAQAAACGYFQHEFGDVHLIL